MEQENQTQQEFNPELTFTLTLQDVNAVLAALSKAPLEHVLNAYMGLRQEAERQIAAIQEAEKAKAETPNAEE